jgi:hypothetical protein
VLSNAKHSGRRAGQEKRFVAGANEEFFGYTRRRTWYPAGIPNGTREVIDLVAGLAAPMAVALTNEYVTGKRNAIDSYVAAAAEPWSSFVRTLYVRCAVQWHYRIPIDEQDQHALRDLFLSVQAFENHYLELLPC